jgi:hypothetical protein
MSPGSCDTRSDTLVDRFLNAHRPPTIIGRALRTCGRRTTAEPSIERINPSFMPGPSSIDGTKGVASWRLAKAVDTSVVALGMGPGGLSLIAHAAPRAAVDSAGTSRSRLSQFTRLRRFDRSAASARGTSRCGTAPLLSGLPTSDKIPQRGHDAPIMCAAGRFDSRSGR